MVTGALLFAKSARSGNGGAPNAGASTAAASTTPNVAPGPIGSTGAAPNTASGATTQTASPDTKRPANTQVAGGSAAAPNSGNANASQEVERVRNAQIAAFRARRVARDAGATAAQLQDGDTHEQRGEDALRDKRYAAAFTHFTNASASFDVAQRAAKLAASAAAGSASVASVTRDTPKVNAPTTSASPPVQQAPPVTTAPLPAVQPQSTQSTARPANPAVEINAVINEYARAIESRDIAELKRTYPGITREQQQRFADFFSSVRSLQATLRVTSLEVDGATADARLSGTYEYVTNGGKDQRQVVTFVAQLRRDANAWRLVSIR